MPMIIIDVVTKTDDRQDKTKPIVTYPLAYTCEAVANVALYTSLLIHEGLHSDHN